MGERRPTRGPNSRVREATHSRRAHDAELERLIKRGDFGPKTMKRISELLRQMREESRREDDGQSNMPD